MNTPSQEIKSIPFYLILGLAFIVIYFSVFLHESAHWAVLEILGCNPTMGFTGIIQQWDEPPTHPEEWQQLHYEEIGTGWLRMERLPRSNTQWAIMLLSGQLVPVILILLGFILVRWGTSLLSKTVGLMLVFVNGAMSLTKIIGWIMGNIGDLFFFSLYSGIHFHFINALFILILGTGLVWSLRQLPCPVRRRWMQALVVGYILIILPLQKANGVLLQAIDRGAAWAMPLVGWSKPVWWVTIFFIIMTVIWSYLFKSQTGVKDRSVSTE